MFTGNADQSKAGTESRLLIKCIFAQQEITRDDLLLLFFFAV